MASAGSFTADLATLLVRELEGFQRELELFEREADIWHTVPGVTNSAGNLALHVAGNLQHFVGAVLSQTGYVRNRVQEFGQRDGTRTDIASELAAAIRVVRDVLPRLTEAQLVTAYPAPVVPDRPIRTDLFLMHLCSHAAFHLGQAGYLRRALTGDSRSSGPLPLALLGG